jgi:O-antigen/teichoic acid export membrane protein
MFRWRLRADPYRMATTQRFFSSLFLLILLNALIKPVWVLGIDREVQNIAGTTTYGSYFALFNLTYLFNFFLDLGFTTAWNQRAAQQLTWLTAQYRNALGVKLLLTLGYGLLMLALYGVLPVARPDWLLLLAINQCLLSLFLFLRNTLTALHWFRADALCSIADKGLLILLCGACLLWPERLGVLSVSRFLWLQTFSLTALVSLLLWLLWRGAGLSVLPRFGFQGILLRTALPFGGIVLLMSVHNRADGFLLERWHPNGAYEAGVYAAAYRLLDAGNMVGFLVAGFLLPFIARHRNKPLLVRKVAGLSAILLLSFAVVVISVILFAGSWLHHLLYRQGDAYHVEVLTWCMAALAGYCLTQVYGTVLTALGHTTILLGVTAVAVVVNLLLNGWLIPLYGAKGAAIAALVSQSGYGLALWYLSSRITKNTT